MEVNGVEFIDEVGADTVSNIQIVRSAPTGMIAWLVKKKVVKTGHQAELVLLGVTVVASLLAAGIFLFSHTGVPKVQSNSPTTLGPARPNPAGQH